MGLKTGKTIARIYRIQNKKTATMIPWEMLVILVLMIPINIVSVKGRSARRSIRIRTVMDT